MHGRKRESFNSPLSALNEAERRRTLLHCTAEVLSLSWVQIENHEVLKETSEAIFPLSLLYAHTYCAGGDKRSFLCMSKTPPRYEVASIRSLCRFIHLLWVSKGRSSWYCQQKCRFIFFVLFFHVVI